MQEIGKFLQENRIQQNKSIDDISNITKMNINIITNIEAGNIGYFNNDLSYLRYYIRSYMSALNVEIEDLDKQLNAVTMAYTQSIDVLEQERFDQLNDHIKSKKVISKTRRSPMVNARKVDWTLISLISIVTLIAAFLVYSIAMNVINKPENETPPIVDVPKDDEKDKDDKPVEEDPIVPEEKLVTINSIDSNNFELVDWLDNTQIISKFNTETWVQMSVNGVVVLLPNEAVSSRVYTPGESLIIEKTYTLNGEEIEFKEEDVISVRYGIMNTNEFFINDQPVELEEAVKTALGGTNLSFTLKQKGN